MSSADPPTRLQRERALRDLVRLHDEMEREAAALGRRHRARMACRRGCADCCVDELTVSEVEAERIRRAAPRLLAEGTPHPRGACAFLDRSGSCRIYADRPGVCRSQGLPLRWQEPRPEGGSIELRDICPLNAAGPPVATLPEAHCWSVEPWEQRLAPIQRDFAGRVARVPLRGLFRRSGAASRAERPACLGPSR